MNFNEKNSNKFVFFELFLFITKLFYNFVDAYV